MKLNEQAVLRFMEQKDYRPINAAELARRMEIHANDRAALRNILRKLVGSGRVLEGAKNRLSLPKQMEVPLKKSKRSKHPDQQHEQAISQSREFVGTIRFQASGFAWVYADLAAKENAGINFAEADRFRCEAFDCGNALDGDRVRVTAIKSAPLRTNGASADAAPKVRVSEVLTRRSGRVVGIFRRKAKFSWVEVEDVAVRGNLDLSVESTAQNGQLVVVMLDTWDRPDTAPRGRVVEVLGWPGDPGVDILSIIHRCGLRTSFPEDVLAEAHGTAEMIPEAEMARRQDWRERLVMTIDPADAKDHDDAIWLEKIPSGWRLAVHIADVSWYVKPGTAMDREAQERGNSTYLVDRVLPMLPPELSNGICSLKPDVDRLTKCALLEIDHGGRIAHAEFFDAVIHSRAKLSYEMAQTMLDGDDSGDPAATAMVREAWKMAEKMRQARFTDGALDLEFPEFRVAMDDQGRASEVREVIHTPSHQLIEECMLAANQAVALALKRRQKPSIYRIHEDPDFAKLNAFADAARAFGYHVGDLSNRRHIQELLDSAKGNPDEHVVKLGLLKSLRRAAYSVDPLGHFGLAKADYCHFTSPIRRYADLIVHRSLQALLKNPPKHQDRLPSMAELTEMARHISETERSSAAAESETKQLKLMEWLARAATLGDDAPPLQGIITEVRQMGLFVEAVCIGMKGVVKREDLPAGDWFYDPVRLCMRSRDGSTYQAGQALSLRVGRVDFARKFVDFRIAPDATAPATGQTSPPPRYAAKPKKGKTSAPKHGTNYSEKSPRKPVDGKSKPRAKPSPSAKKSAKPQKQKRP
jgi:ribonuclease R